jgi:cellobiose-specific phosphotransferase system component IIA
LYLNRKKVNSLTGQEKFTDGPSTTSSSGSIAASATGTSITSKELEAFKEEILEEMRLEIQKAKQEIIQGMKIHTNFIRLFN